MRTVTSNLKLKLFVLFLITCMVPIIGIAYFNYINIKENLTSSTQKHLEAIAQLKSYEIENFIEQKINEITILATSPYIDTLFTNHHTKELQQTRDYKMLQKQILHFISKTENDEIYIYTPSKEQLLEVTTTKATSIKYVQEAIKEGFNKTFFSEIYKSNDDKLICITIAMPIFNTHNQPIAIIVAEIILNKFFDQIQDYVGLGETGETLLAKKIDNKIVFLNALRYDKKASLHRTITMGSNLGVATQKAFEGDKGSGLTTDYRGEKVIAAWRSIKPLDWGLVAKIDSNEVYKVSDSALNTIFIYSGLLIVFLAILTFYASMNILSPIKKTELDALEDPLTHLPNRRAIEKRLQEILQFDAQDTKVAILFLDLDGFKNVNDTYGHNIGDLLLQEVATRLLASVRQDDIVARLGGDEFIVLLKHIQSSKNIELIAQKIIETLNQPFQFNHITAHIGTSIGISIFPDNTLNLSELIQKADKAMYISKTHGKNQYTFC